MCKAPFIASGCRRKCITLVFYSCYNLAAMKTSVSRRSVLVSPGLVLLITCIAFGLRVFRLDANAIWWDESLSLYRATQDLPTILANTIQIQTILTTDLQPPLYFLLLHFLVTAFGTNEFGLRFLSVAANAATIPLMYALGRRWFSEAVGLIAALAGALSAFWVWYAQEARPYALALFLSLLAIYALARAYPPKSQANIDFRGSAGESRGTRAGAVWIWGYALAAIAALYTNYYAVFLFPFHVIYIFLQTRSVRQSLLPTLPALSAVLLLPMVARGAAGNVNSGPSFVALDIILRDLLHSFSVGITLDAPQTRWIDATMLILFIFGMLLSHSGAPFSHFVFRVVLVAFLVVPTLVLFGLSYLRPLYQNSRYLITWSPAFYLGVALGIGTLGRTLKPLALPGLAVIAFGAVLSLGNLYFDLDYAKDDHRAWAESLRDRAHAGDYLILDSPHTEELFKYYSHGIVPYSTLPVLTDAGAVSYEADRLAVHSALALNPRVWFLSMHVPFDDPDVRIEKLLNQEGVLLDRAQFRGSSTSISLSLFSQTLPSATINDIANRTDFLFDTRLHLLGWDAPKVITPGTRGVVKLFWQLEEPAGEDYGVSLRAIDTAGARVGQGDAIPLGNVSGSSSWAAKKIVVDAHDLPIAADSVPGVYRLQIQVYHSATGNPIGDVVILGPVTVR